jgi:aspartyl-tRNA(Asn)/glutamyl-tRNA(Gln) amidotransferase subunit A
MTLAESTAAALLDALGCGECTAVDATSACLKRIRRFDPGIAAFLRVDADAALAQAEAVDRKRRAGQPLGPLAGLPVAVKDILCQRGERTTCASKILGDYRAPYDATVVQRLRAADAVLIGRTNMDEFAMGGSTENSAFGPTRNPWDRSRTPGGSSGGSAAAVAASFAPLAIGTDTGGSIRQPAGLCGVTGLKPTYGRVSRYGLVAFASSLDQIGPMAHTAEDAALLLSVIAGHDPLDATSVNVETPDYRALLDQPLKGLKLGMVTEHFDKGLDPVVERAVREAIGVYESLGAQVRPVSLPHGRYGVATYYVIAPCEASSNLARYDGAHFGHRTDEARLLAALAAEQRQAGAAGGESPLVRMYRQSRAEGFGPEVKRRIMLGTYALSAGYYDAYYLKALKVRRLIRQDYDRAFSEVDLIVGPVTTSPAFQLGEKVDDPLAMYLVDLYTVSANLAGIAGLAIPCGFSDDGLPLGLQLQGPPFSEAKLLAAAHGFQQATDWHARRPTLA